MLSVLIIISTTLLILTDPPALQPSPPTEMMTNHGDTVRSEQSRERRAEREAKEKRASPTSRRSESIARRIERLTAGKRGGHRFPKTEKYPQGTVIELNGADTTSLKKVPGIGSSFAKRIVNYRTLLGGYYTIEQLREVYGMGEERYAGIAPWFTVDRLLIRPLQLNQLSADTLRKHPYISYRQARAIRALYKQKGALTGWENLTLLEEFTSDDAERLLPYLSFE